MTTHSTRPFGLPADVGHCDRQDGYTLYRIYGNVGNGEWLAYVGISKCWQRRMLEHAQDKPWWECVAGVDIWTVCCRAHALETERRVIEDERPWFNKAGNQHYVDGIYD